MGCIVRVGYRGIPVSPPAGIAVLARRSNFVFRLFGNPDEALGCRPLVAPSGIRSVALAYNLDELLVLALACMPGWALVGNFRVGSWCILGVQPGHTVVWALGCRLPWVLGHTVDGMWGCRPDEGHCSSSPWGSCCSSGPRPERKEDRLRHFSKLVKQISKAG